MNTQACGHGLARQAQVPAKFGELLQALVDVMELHAQSLDRNDQAAVAENDVYMRVTQGCRQAIRWLGETAHVMTAAGTLSAAPHDDIALRSDRANDALARFTRVEEEMLGVLGAALAQHRKLQTR